MHTVQDGKVYTRESLGANIGDLFYSIAVMSRAHDESLTKSKRGLDNWKRKRALAGTQVVTRMAPGWLKLAPDGRTWIVDKYKAQVVRRVFALVADGYGREAVAKKLNADHVPLPTRRGITWHAGTIYKLINSASVIGSYQPSRRDGWKRVPDGEPIADYYPPIVPRALWLKTRSSAVPFPKGPQAGTPNLFATLLHCSKCRGRIHVFNKGKGVAYLQCAKSRRGLCSVHRGWHYQRFEVLVTTLLSRCIRWSSLVPSQKAAARTALDTLIERLATVEVDAEATRLKLARVTDAIEAGANVSTLLDRMLVLEKERAGLVAQAAKLKAEVDAERDKLRTVVESVEESKTAFQDWQKGGDVARHRLSVVLRRMLKAITLSATTEERKLEIVFRDDAPETFVVSADLTHASDTSGEEVV